MVPFATFDHDRASFVRSRRAVTQPWPQGVLPSPVGLASTAPASGGAASPPQACGAPTAASPAEPAGASAASADSESPARPASDRSLPHTPLRAQQPASVNPMALCDGHAVSGVPGAVSKQTAPASKSMPEASKAPASNVARAAEPKVAPQELSGKQHGDKGNSPPDGALHVALPHMMGGVVATPVSLVPCVEPESSEVPVSVPPSAVLVVAAGAEL